MAKTLRGDKISSRHSTYSDLAGKVITALKDQPEVTKIVLGLINNKSTNLPRVKITVDKNNSLKLQCHGNDASQVLFVVGINVIDCTRILELKGITVK